jgi:fucose permease
MQNIKTGRLIVAAILAIFVYGVIAAMLGTIMPSFTLTPEQKGNVALAQALGLVIASISVGPLIDARGKKTALVLGLALITVSLFTLPNVAGYGLIALLFFLMGVGGGIIVTAANALVSDIGEKRRAPVLNLLNLFFGLGGLLTPFIAANLLSDDTVRILYFAAILATITFLAQVSTNMPGPSGERGFKLSEAGAVLGRPSLYLLALFLFLYVSCEVGVWNWLKQYLISRNVDVKTAGNILSLGFALGLLLGRIIVSRILIRVSAITVTLFSAILMAVTTYLMLGTRDPTIAWIAVFCAGLAMAPVFPTTLAMVGDAFPRMTATAMGIVITCGWIGLAVSSPIIGSVAGENNTNLGTALLIIPGFSVAMIVVNLLLRPTLKSHKA